MSIDEVKIEPLKDNYEPLKIFIYIYTRIHTHTKKKKKKKWYPTNRTHWSELIDLTKCHLRTFNHRKVFKLWTLGFINKCWKACKGWSSFTKCQKAQSSSYGLWIVNKTQRHSYQSLILSNKAYFFIFFLLRFFT